MESSIVVTFRVGYQTFALPLRAVQQVVRLPELTPIAGASPLIAGLINARGHLLPVVVGHRLLEQPLAITLNSMVIIVGLDPEQPQLGLLVDEVYGVAHAAPECITPIEVGSALLPASLRSAEGVIPILDVSVLLASVTGRAAKTVAGAIALPH